MSTFLVSSILYTLKQVYRQIKWNASIVVAVRGIARVYNILKTKALLPLQYEKLLISDCDGYGFVCVA